MGRMSTSILFWSIISWASFAAVATATICADHGDCPGYVPSNLCTGELCIDHVCVKRTLECSRFCSPYIGKCVDCLRHTDCNYPNEVCDPVLYSCRACREDAECPLGRYCLGGQWLCVSGQCVIPPRDRWPCKDLEHCNDNQRMCMECLTHDDCGTWDFCENPTFCNGTTHRCERDADASDCLAAGLSCDSSRSACVTCVQDEDCPRRSSSFCQMWNQCDLATRTCSWNGTSPCAAQQAGQPDRVIDCDESRKMCARRLCPTGQDSECDDTNDCNGREYCNEDGFCSRREPYTCPPEMKCASDGVTCFDTRLGRSCTGNEDCLPYGLICRPTLALDPDSLACIQCRHDNQCSDNDPSNGEEICNRTTFRCESGVDPCQSAQFGFIYNQATGKCDASFIAQTVLDKMLESESTRTNNLLEGSSNSKVNVKVITPPGSTSDQGIFGLPFLIVVALLILLLVVIIGVMYLVGGCTIMPSFGSTRLARGRGSKGDATNEEAPVDLADISGSKRALASW